MLENLETMIITLIDEINSIKSDYEKLKKENKELREELHNWKFNRRGYGYDERSK